jgi:deoxyribonuclease (pyrimidine dimer)
LTRINCVPVEELHQKHLVAEYRELPRTFKLVEGYLSKHGKLPALPQKYTLGTGHVKFFYDKLLYLSNRQTQLVDEMIRRGYNPTHRQSLVSQFSEVIPSVCWNDWAPTENALTENRQRILDRMPKNVHGIA